VTHNVPPPPSRNLVSESRPPSTWTSQSRWPPSRRTWTSKSGWSVEPESDDGWAWVAAAAAAAEILAARRGRR
jgi:hypothetical protein